MKIGLRIDVDTFRGTKVGVPNLCRLLAENGVRGSFFFSVGPDNMGRNLWRLARPAFLWKMLRTNAPRLYGWDILLRGAFWPGPQIARKLGDVIRAAADAGHEVGLHAWDHHAWQAHIDTMDQEAIRRHLTMGVESLERLLGRAPSCSAAPAWKCSDTVLSVKAEFPFTYNSDCRGESVFVPLVAGRPISQPQVPVSLPTYDEVVGRNGVSDANYNTYILSLVATGNLNVLTIHAEAEGITGLAMFDCFVKGAASRGASLVPLGDLLSDAPDPGHGVVVPGKIPGRDGWVACQVPAEACQGGG